MPTIWVHSESKLIDEALATLLGRARLKVVTGPAKPSRADVAIWSLRTLKPPYPLPPDLPTLALIDGMDSDKICVLNAGYKGYLSGEESAEDVGSAVYAVLGGEVWAERSILSLFVRSQGAPTLTAREHQVLSLIVEGLTNKQIAQRLTLSEKTVKVYVSKILDKLGAKSRTELIVQHVRTSGTKL